MSSNSPDSFLNGTIHYNQSFMEYEFYWNQFPFFLAVIPWLYMIPSFFVILRIFHVFWSTDWRRPKPGMNPHVFLVISLSQFTCFAFFVFDYMTIRLPATGIFTSYCARNDPNHLLVYLLFFTFYTNYSAMIFPCLMPIVRFVIVAFPKSHNKINTLLVRIGVPMILVYPMFFTFFLIPAVGVCKPMGEPFPFGAIFIYYAGSAFGLHNSYFYLFNILFWMIASIIANVVLFVKVARARSKLISLQKSGVSYRAETSITITTVSMLSFYVTTGLFALIYIKFYNHSRFVSYTTMLRPFGNDMQTCIVSLVFYMTHPVFRKRKEPDMMLSMGSFQRRAV